MGIEDKIKSIEEEIQKTPYNKATSHHIGKLKAKLSKLKEESLQRSSGGSKGQGFHVKKSGDATVVLVGFPSVGKSTLLWSTRTPRFRYLTFRESSQGQAAERAVVRKSFRLQGLPI